MRAGVGSGCVLVCVFVFKCVCLNVKVCIRLHVSFGVYVYTFHCTYALPLTVSVSVRACPHVLGLFLCSYLVESVFLPSLASEALFRSRPLMTLWSWRSFEEITELSKWICCFTSWRTSQSSFKISLVNIYLHKKHHYLERKTLGGM